MKKFFYAIAALAVIASCSKVTEVEKNVEPKDEINDEINDEIKDEVNVVNMTIRTQAPQTKTYIESTGEKTYQPQWNSTDKLGVFFDTVEDAYDAELENTSQDGAKAEFYGPVNIQNGSYRVYAYYPSDATISKGSDTQVVFTVPTLQKPEANNFDKNADIAVSKADDIDISGTDVAIDNMVFGRILSTVKVTVNNNNADVDNSETIQGIVISAQDSNLTGTIGWDFESEEAQIIEGESSVSALFKANPLAFGTSFFLLVNPTSITPSADKPLTITIFTEAHTITKTITALGKDLVFPLGGISELNIGTAGATVTEPKIATLVKSPSSLSAGDEVIIAAADYYNVVMSTEQKPNNRGQILAALYDEESIYIAQDTIQRFAVEYDTASGSFAFKGINGTDAVANKYIYAASSNSNHLKSQTNKDGNASFTVVFDQDGVATVTANGNNTRNVLKYNDSSDLFSCYGATSTQKDVAIYRYKAGVYVPSLATPTNLAADYDAGTVTVSWDAVNGADSYTVTLTGKDTQTGITGTSTTFTQVNPGTYTITVTAVSNDHSSMLDSAAASIEPTFVGTVSYDFTTIAELKDLTTATETEYFGELTDAVVSFVGNTQNAVIKDATGSILYYKSGHGLKQGQVFSGELTVKVKTYNGTKEITACNAEFTGNETAVAPEVMTLGQLVGNFETYQSTYVSVSDLTVTAVNGKNISVQNGNYSYIVYSNAGNASVEVGDVITAVGTVAIFNSTDQIKAWKMDDITKTSGGTNPNPNESWVETALANITSSDVFVIVGDNGSTFAMTNNNGTSSAPAATAVTVENGEITSSVSANIKWHLSVDKGNYTFYPGVSGTSTWLYCTNNNNGLRVGNSDNNNNIFTVSDEGYLYNSGQGRYVGIYNSQDWRSYTTINNNIKDQTFKFYVLQN